MTKVIAHRGASGYAPENTMAAFELAIKMGADAIETDVHLSKDGEVIIIHDEKLDRTSDGIGYVQDYTYEALSKFNANNQMENFVFCKIPRLSDLLELIKKHGTKLNIELKTDFIVYPEIEEKVIDLVRAFDVEDQVIYSSFNHYTLANLRKIDPNVKIGILYMEGMYEPWHYATHLKADALHPFYPNLMIEDYVKECHEHHILVNAWTVNKPTDIKRLIDLETDGIITNYPDLALNLLNEKD